MKNHVVRICRAGAAGIASRTFGRKAGAHECRRRALLDRIRSVEARREME